MSNITIEPRRLQGEIVPPADKSISHRAIIIASIAEGETQIRNLSVCEDCLRTMQAFRSMGISIEKNNEELYCIQGKGLNGLSKPIAELYLGNSGTSMRLILGVLAGQRFNCVLSGDSSLSRRPMKRVTQPLSLMGAKIRGRNEGNFAPLSIQGSTLLPICYKMPIPSAQVKSAIILAGLYAEGITTVNELVKSRDHTERLLKKFGASISVEGLLISVTGRANLKGQQIYVPGDISAASFFLVGACIVKNSAVAVSSVGLNPTRIGLLNVLKKMGAVVSWQFEDSQVSSSDYENEARGKVWANYSQLKATTVCPEQIPSLIDELPILMVAATQSEGTTIIRGAGELRVKETDRINAMISNLTKMRATIDCSDDDIIIHGPRKLIGATVDSFQDHRIAMSMAIAGFVARGRTTIKNVDCVDISFPGFFQMLERLCQS
jgi:3-phosphoshikimate 1-carboxyvinyltransferase